MKTTHRLFTPMTLLQTVLLLVGGAGSTLKGQGKNVYLVYVGTYTVRHSQGIYAYRFEARTGRLSSLGLAAESTSPSFLAADPTGRFLYAVNEVASYQGKKSGAVSAFSIDRHTGRLTGLNEVSSSGPGPCFVSLDKTGKYVLVANYDGGSVAVFPVLADGRLGEATSFVQHEGSSADRERQSGPHAHSIEVSPDNRFALAADLGLDKLLVYRFDPAQGSLTPNQPDSAMVRGGLGPRHFAFHPSGKFVYLVSEMGSAVTAFSYDGASGTLHEIETISTLPKGFTGQNDDAEIAVHPDGKFLYASNRGHDSIAVFSIDPAKGTLTPIQDVPTQGKTPRNFSVDPAGSYLFAANQDSDTLVIFRIDVRTGRLTPTGQVVNIASPVCVTLVRAQ
ncbi:MAG TPA: lactonase family protein [Terriglobia bacterium]|nr:lactonase family protein [Terriglobia bacterium]